MGWSTFHIIISTYESDINIQFIEAKKKSSNECGYRNHKDNSEKDFLTQIYMIDKCSLAHKAPNKAWSRKGQFAGSYPYKQIVFMTETLIIQVIKGATVSWYQLPGLTILIW